MDPILRLLSLMCTGKPNSSHLDVIFACGDKAPLLSHISIIKFLHDFGAGKIDNVVSDVIGVHNLPRITRVVYRGPLAVKKMFTEMQNSIPDEILGWYQGLDVVNVPVVRKVVYDVVTVGSESVENVMPSTSMPAPREIIDMMETMMEGEVSPLKKKRSDGFRRLIEEKYEHTTEQAKNAYIFIYEFVDSAMCILSSTSPGNKSYFVLPPDLCEVARSTSI